jgi:hypothetical protein
MVYEPVVVQERLVAAFLNSPTAFYLERRCLPVTRIRFFGGSTTLLQRTQTQPPKDASQDENSSARCYDKACLSPFTFELVSNHTIDSLVLSQDN